MTQDLPPIILKGKQLAKYRHLKRKYPVSGTFLKRNYENLKRFVMYAINPHCVLRRYAWRKRDNRVLIVQRIRHLLFDPRLKRMIKRRKKNVKQWSQRVVSYHKKMGRIEQHEETELYEVPQPISQLGAEEVSKQMKEQLQLLKSGKRGISLIKDANKNVQLRQTVELTEVKEEVLEPIVQLEEDTAEQLSEAKKAVDAVAAIKEEESESSSSPKDNSTPEKAAGGSKFLDMLISKVRVKNFAMECNFSTRFSKENSPETAMLAPSAPGAMPIKSEPVASPEVDSNATTTTTEGNTEDSSDDFLGFDESGHQPGMLLTPLVPQSCKTLAGNAAFVSASLEEYMRKNNMNETPQQLLAAKGKFEPRAFDGLVTPKSTPPAMDMPAVPEALQKLRTVAERRQYLQRFSKNHKLAIINNEANIYRELLRKQRNQKVKAASMVVLQAPTTQMPFTRSGWRAASYVATEHNKYYYQVIRIDGEQVKLPGALGNNVSREKRPHRSILSKAEAATLRCGSHCLDAAIWRDLKVLKTKEKKAKLNQYPLPAVFRPCPLSQKPYQKPLDDDTAALLLAGGSMAVVSMPTVELEVEPALGRPLDEIAKRYLQHILPHHDITREWAEFSVSTLQQQQSSSMRAAEEEAAKTQAGRRRSFTFVIPYLNDRNHILVRRVVDRSEQLDASFAQSQEKLQEFQFRQELKPAEEDAAAAEIQLACADMISDMINTVAISCSENSFISVDPDGLDVQKPAAQEIATKLEPDLDVKPKTGKMGRPLQSKHQQPSKQHRLRLELRRLNATIIDAAATKCEKSDEPCSKGFCQLGCVCESLIMAGERRSAREHCGRAKCVLECSCKGSELTRVMRVETDGRGISNEDAFNLRQKATARLAKMEKEFTSTLVLTENETLLINESQCDKKRRCTKAPKRYEDFAADSDEEHVSPPKQAKNSAGGNSSVAGVGGVKRSVVNIESTKGGAGSSSSSYAHVTALTEPCSVLDTDMAKLQHCFVALRRLPDVSNLATFCMTHQLYKCFCGGESLDGKPVIIEKEVPNSTVAHYVPELATRASYSFERPPEEPPKKQRKVAKVAKAVSPPNIIITKQEPTLESVIVDALNRPIETKPAMEPPSGHAELFIIQGYFNSRPQFCRRAVGVPRNCYLRLNRQRALKVREQLTRIETPQSQELLNTRIFGAIRFYRAELDQQRRVELQRQLTRPINSPVIVVRDDSDETAEQLVVAAVAAAKKRSSHNELSEPKKLPVKRIKLAKEQPKEKPPTAAATPPPPEMIAAIPAPAESDIQVPRIAACYSLNTAAASMGSIDVVSSGLASAVASASGNANLAQDSNFRGFYNEVVKNMNALVSKKMQDIDMALQRESKIIPAPNEEILCIIKWTNFLAAFESDFVFIWEVKMKNYSFLAATTTNMMPAVCGALAVINIFALDQSNLPLMARMLMQSIRTENTRRLAVVMQGRQQYWLVKGFLRHMAGNACTKPTPQTHPLLTKKINVLCSLLVKQRIREHQRKQASGGASEASTSSSSTTTPPPPSPSPLPKTPPPPPLTVKLTPMSQPPTPSQQLPVKQGKASSSSSTEKAAPRASLTLPSKAAPTVSLTPTAVAASKDAVFHIRSNIDFRKVSNTDVEELQLPELHSDDHRWVVLDLFNDFSHIFVPAFKDMISLDRIHNVMKVSAEKKKVVKLQFFQDAPYDAFVTPASRRKIYFGPLRLDMLPPVLVLLQSVDGNMMLREVYQREHAIPVQQERRTMAFWVLHINGQVHFEIELEGSEMTEKRKKLTRPALNIVKYSGKLANQSPSIADKTDPDPDPDDDDDDCMIIDDDEEPEPQQKKKPRSSFTIQMKPQNGCLEITPASPPELKPQNILAAAAPPKDLIRAGGFVPFIANSPSQTTTTTPPAKSPPATATTDASSAAPAVKLPHFITPQVQLTQSPAPAATAGAGVELTEPSPAKISRISVHTNKINESLQQLLGPNSLAPSTVVKVANAGITITKLPQSAKEANSAIAIGGAKRTSSGQAKPSNSTPLAPIIIKKTATTIAIGNLPANYVARPPPSSKVARQSLPPVNIAPKPAVKAEVSEEKPKQPSPPASQPNKPAPKSSYGFLVPPSGLTLPRFRVKVVDTFFMVKVPEVGLLRLKSCEAAGKFLNRHLSRNELWRPHLPVEWKFVLNQPAVANNAPKSCSEAAILIED